ncbi:MAG: hypothetical protein RR320_04480, partial [Oscillospiraceae bacterium]
MKQHNRMKAILSLTLTAAILASAPVQVMASGGDNAGSGIVQSVTARSISVNVRNADVRDVLSAVAVNMGYSIVYNGGVGTITIKLDDVLPETAFDYILKGMGMTYLQEGSTLIVGTREMLNQDFARSLSLTSFELRYVTPDVLTSKIQQLKLPVTVLSLATNENALWVQGFPADIAKVRELISILDIEENYDGSGVDVPDKSRKTLSYVRLNYLTAYEFNRFLKTLGIDNGLSISDDDDRLWIYANSDERKTISDLRSKVDHSNSYIDVEGADTFDKILVKNISKANAVAAVKAVCPGLTLISVDNASKVFFVKGSREDIERAKELIGDLDGLNAEEISTTVFAHEFKHITAAEGSRRLENVTFGDNVTWYATTHDEFSTVLFVYCNADYQKQIVELLETIDQEKALTVNMPVYSAKNPEAAAGMVSFLVAMLGNRVEPLIDVKTYNNMSVVYLLGADAETVQLVDQMIERLGH